MVQPEDHGPAGLLRPSAAVLAARTAELHENRDLIEGSPEHLLASLAGVTVEDLRRLGGI